MKNFTNRLIRIYTLTNPINGDIFWVGQTTLDLNTRLSGHINEIKDGMVSPKREIIRTIMLFGKMPLIEDVETFICNSILDKVYINEMEEYWIEQHKQWGFKLANVHGGRIKYINKEKRLLERNNH